jgi:hypothetical protein
MAMQEPILTLAKLLDVVQRASEFAVERAPPSVDEQPSGPALASSSRRKDALLSAAAYASCGRRRNLQAGYQNSTRRTM